MGWLRAPTSGEVLCASGAGLAVALFAQANARRQAEREAAMGVPEVQRTSVRFVRIAVVTAAAACLAIIFVRRMPDSVADQAGGACGVTGPDCDDCDDGFSHPDPLQEALEYIDHSGDAPF